MKRILADFQVKKRLYGGMNGARLSNGLALFFITPFLLDGIVSFPVAPTVRCYRKGNNLSEAHCLRDDFQTHIKNEYFLYCDCVSFF
jgi:hypothetical protein